LKGHQEITDIIVPSKKKYLRVFSGPLGRSLLLVYPGTADKDGGSRAKRVDTDTFPGVYHSKFPGHSKDATLNKKRELAHNI
jgi:hypothetical protein